jgi:hypothetical protein
MTITEDLIKEVKKVQVYNALRIIVNHSSENSLNWAVNYAKYGLTITDEGELRTQCLYILGNITRWRGPVAKEVRMILKRYCGIK